MRAANGRPYILKGESKRSFIDKRHWDATVKRLEMICERARNGEHIRIWYGNDADSYSSYLWLVSELQHFNCEITAIAFNDTAYELEPHCYNWVRVNMKDLLLFAYLKKLPIKAAKTPPSGDQS